MTSFRLEAQMKHRRFRRSPSPTVGLVVVLTVALAMMASLPLAFCESTHDQDAASNLQQEKQLPRIPVYSFNEEKTSPIARKQLHDLQQTLPSDLVYFETISLTFDQQRYYLQNNPCGDKAAERFDEFLDLEQEHFAVEVFKWCVLSTSKHDATIFLESTSPLLIRLQDLVQGASRNMVVLGDEKYFPGTIHGSFILLRKSQKRMAKEMLKTLVEPHLDSLLLSPLLIPRTLHRLVSAQVPKGGASSTTLEPGDLYPSWRILEQTCRMDPLRRMGKPSSWTDTNSYRLIHRCPENNGFCCNIQDVHARQVVLMGRHPILPVQRLPTDLAQPYNAATGHFEEEEVPYISTIREVTQKKPEGHVETPNFYDMLLENDCLPASEDCSKCLRDKTGANCTTCAEVCSCYCKKLCHERVEPKFVTKKLYVQPPRYARDSTRLIPRIVHQTWFEDLDKEKYPNMSRLVESFKMSGWEYKFYSDDAAANFLSTHFPPEVREAYDTLKPGAFKADLFRYCVLLIHGGVYADVDIQLESTLDFSIPADVGLMVPVDEPGKPVNRQMCLWNGFIAAAPGHPVLAKAIETIVNQVRNRFTSVDSDATFCPNPELSVLHAYDTLFTAGPCLFGSTLNRVLGRHGQASFVPGELNPWADPEQRAMANEGTSFVLGTKSSFIGTDGANARIPGRIVILKQNKWDMGAHRFTLLEQNLVVSATDLPDSNDREAIEATQSSGPEHEHYSKTHAKVGIYGLEGLYTDLKKANERILIFVDNEHQAKKIKV